RPHAGTDHFRRYDRERTQRGGSCRYRVPAKARDGRSAARRRRARARDGERASVSRPAARIAGSQLRIMSTAVTPKWKDRIHASVIIAWPFRVARAGHAELRAADLSAHGMK